MLKIFLSVSVALNLIFGFLFFQSKSTPTNLFQVERIIDGDTFIIEGNRQIRLMSVNAPEVSWCGSDQATAKLTELISGKKVRLVGEINDHFGRFLALYVFKPSTPKIPNVTSKATSKTAKKLIFFQVVAITVMLL